ncbi:MAG: AI-2E family transporter [Cytophagaceae bacterium]
MQVPPSIKWVVVLIGISLIFFIFSIGSNVVIPVFIALLFSLLMLPFCKWMERKGLSRGAASFFSVLAMIFIVLGLVFFIIWQIDRLAQDMYQVEQQFQKFVTQVQLFLERNFEIDREQQQEFLDDIRESSNGMFENVMSMTSSLLIASILIPMSMFFMLFYRKNYETFLYKLFPKEQHKQLDKVILNEKKIVFQYITGIFTVVLILAICNYIALSIFGVDQALLFAVIAALLNIIPLVGTFIGSILPVAYTLIMEDSIFLPLGIALYFWIIQILESNIITPNIVGDRVRINPYAIILAIFIGGEVWGPAGMVLFIPMLAILKVVFKLSDSLEPYGYLLSDPNGDEESLFQKLKRKIKGK